jgi:hypothetical protein
LTGTRRFTRSLERILLGVAMIVVAHVVERASSAPWRGGAHERRIAVAGHRGRLTATPADKSRLGDPRARSPDHQRWLRDP